MDIIYDLDFDLGEKVFVNYVDGNNRSVKGFATIMAKHFIDDELHFIISASSDIINGVGRMSPHIPDLAIVCAEEIEPSYVSLKLIVDNTKKSRKKRKIINE